MPEPKKFRREYQPTDPRTGLAIGPPQVFEADTRDELIDKIQGAHVAASVKLHETRRAVKLGNLMEPDPEQPILTFEERQLTADERTKLTNELRDPKTTSDAIVQLLEAKLGAPISVIRDRFREQEVEKRANYMRGQIELFKDAHPEYVECDHNLETMVAYLNKNKMALTKKNLEIAYDDLTADNLLTVQVVAASAPAPVTQVPASNGNPPEETIPPQATTDPAITGDSTEPRPRQSSSGLSARDTSATPTDAAPKAKGITAAEINSMGLDEYSERMKDPTFRKAVDDLYQA